MCGGRFTGPISRRPAQARLLHRRVARDSAAVGRGGQAPRSATGRRRDPRRGDPRALHALGPGPRARVAAHPTDRHPGTASRWSRPDRDPVPDGRGRAGDRSRIDPESLEGVRRSGLRWSRGALWPGLRHVFVHPGLTDRRRRSDGFRAVPRRRPRPLRHPGARQDPLGPRSVASRVRADGARSRHDRRHLRLGPPGDGDLSRLLGDAHLVRQSCHAGCDRRLPRGDGAGGATRGALEPVDGGGAIHLA